MATQDASEGEIFRVEGSGGEKILSGTVPISGSKNEALPLLASAALFSDTLRISNVPVISDIEKMTALLTGLGATVTGAAPTLSIDGSSIAQPEIDRATARAFRASIILTGPILARLGSVTFPPPGGCIIGKRPIDVFLHGYQKMGATVTTTEDSQAFTITAPPGGLRGGEIVFRVQSVTGTEALLMAAALAHGTTVLKNVALEPEVTALAEFLSSVGVPITGIGTSTLSIVGTGGRPLVFGDSEPVRVIPDRIEAGSFIVLGALCAHELTISGCDPSHLELPIETLRECGVSIEVSTDSVLVKGKPTNRDYGSGNVRTHEYPGFPTDLQAPFGIFYTQVTGESVIEEMVFEGRLGYLEDIKRMGADITLVDAHKAIIKGPAKLVGRELYSPDLRAGLAYIIAACVGRGTSHIHNIHHIDRGYERLEEKLRAIGVAIERIPA